MFPYQQAVRQMNNPDVILPRKTPMPTPRQYWLVLRDGPDGEEQLFQLDCLAGEFWTEYAKLGFDAEADMDAGVVERTLLSTHRV